jgi:hypothetical protein
MNPKFKLLSLTLLAAVAFVAVGLSQATHHVKAQGGLQREGRDPARPR